MSRPESHLHLVRGSLAPTTSEAVPETATPPDGPDSLRAIFASLGANQRLAEPQRPWDAYANGDPRYLEKPPRNDEEARHYFGFIAQAIDPYANRMHGLTVTQLSIPVREELAPKGAVDVASITKVVKGVTQVAANLRTYDSTARFTHHASFMYTTVPERYTNTEQLVTDGEGWNWRNVYGRQAIMAPRVGELMLAYLFTVKAAQLTGMSDFQLPRGTEVFYDSHVRQRLLTGMGLIDSSAENSQY